MEKLKNITDYFSTITDSSFSPITVYEPTDEQSEKRGNLYLLLDLSPSIYPLGTMISRIFETEYYQKAQNESPMQRLEAALTIANKKILGYLQTKQNNNYRCSIVAAIFHENILHLVQIGEAHVLLLRQGSFKKIGNVKSFQESIPQFHNIATGSVQEGDTLVLTTTNLLERFELKKLKQIIAANYPSTAIAHMRELVKPASLTETFSIILVEFSSPEAHVSNKEKSSWDHSNNTFNKSNLENTYPSAIPTKKTIIENLDNPKTHQTKTTDQLYRNEQNTTSILTPIEQEINKMESISKNIYEPQFPNHLQKQENSIEYGNPVFPNRTKPTTPEEIPTYTFNQIPTTEGPLSKLNPPKKLTINYSLPERIKNSITQIKKKFSGVSENLPNFQKKVVKTIQESPLIENAKHGQELITTKAKKLHRSHWFLIMGILSSIFLLLVIMNTVRKQQISSQVSSLLTSSQNQLDAASGLIKSNDIPGARKQLLESKKTTEQVLKIDPKNKPVFQIQNTINESLDKIDGIVRITDSKPLEDLQKLDKNAKQASNLLLLNQNLYILDSKIDKLFNYSLNNNKLSLKLEAPNQAKSMLSLTAIDNNIYIYSKDGKVNEFNTQTEQMRTLTVFGGSWAKGEKLISYFNTLYLLDITQDQIWRYRPLGDSYSSPSRYFDTTAVSLAGTIDIAIEGDVYALKNNGQLLRYTQQRKPDTTFVVTNITPPLEKPTALFTGPGENDSIFIAESSTKRIIELNKNGQFLHQYIIENPNIKNIDCFVIDFGKNTAYFLSDSRIYKFPLEQ
ncbi:MAG: hypothetical protein WCP97_03080 [bacterium]